MVAIEEEEGDEEEVLTKPPSNVTIFINLDILRTNIYANQTTFNEDEEILLMSYVEMQNSNREAMWFLDSGCSNHMSGDRRWFVQFDESYRHLVKLGNGTRMAVMGKEAFELFKKVKSMVKTKISSPICCLRTHRSGEFTSSTFNDFCANHGIRRQHTAAYTPQQNGVVERQNCTLMNMIKCMLNDKKIPLEFWPEAANWTAHVLNRCPTTAVKDKAPGEA
ncbi:retrovirus-related pol polyprotein from transposon TNT 1-94 [Tanacetum coccineum]